MNTTMKVCGFCFCAMMAITACDRRTGNGTGPVLPSATTEAGGGSRDARPRVTLTGPVRGSSNIDTMPHFSVSVFCPEGGACAADVPATLASVAAKVKIWDTSGNVTNVVPEALQKSAQIDDVKGAPPQSSPSSEFRGGLVASAPLAVDAKFDVEITSDSDVVFGFVDSSSGEQKTSLNSSKDKPTSFRIPIFTGSAPTASRIDFSNDGVKPIMSIRLRFSEPISISTLATGLSVKSVDGTVLSGCVWSAGNQKCADAASSEVSELVDYVLQVPSTPDALKSATLQIAGTVKGSDRTVEEGAKFSGQLIAAFGAQSGLSFALRQASWESCSSRGDVQCVRYIAQ